MESKVKETLRKKNIALVQELILRKEARDASVNLVLQEQFYQYIQEIVNGKEGEDFFSGGGDPVDKSRFYRKDCC